ncbi:3-hydroxyacyl-CoA dehydrogenase family protein [Syntrophomonas wolfei]|jgi:3-hydroxybutyryl-CoA dehydrogenase|uniref:3-hydroxybutyryl-CoA dehydrogenase n=1 Tax=Syntrophomonas wolfei TaxID=863 RepID=A0A354Z0I9_9FIRM|nr:3-hydroxyacyl-CoA dehydrogenase NAD-binding domain-containing protein [Syntrophomonas wolfei]HBK54481.1 3-hydroxybutyryl-CoA dehydrogenase [Syntrophomonas wolfei]
MEIKKIGVLGAGTMGAGIAQVAAEAGFPVILVDIETAIIEKALKAVKKAWKKAMEKGKLDESEMQKREGYLSTGNSMADFKDCDVVIEAIVEKIEVKKAVFKELDEICPKNTILASNTSALSITEIAAATGRPDRVVGMHFFNPVPVMKLVEVIPGAESSEAVSSAIVELCKKLKKEPVLAREFPGFIVNRILVPYINEAAMAFQDGVASAEEIDKAMKLGANMPMGPLALCDLVGIDVLLMVCEYFWQEFGDSKYRPSLALKQKVRAGHLGVKSGKGFYDYK